MKFKARILPKQTECDILRKIISLTKCLDHVFVSPFNKSIWKLMCLA